MSTPILVKCKCCSRTIDKQEYFKSIAKLDAEFETAVSFCYSCIKHFCDAKRGNCQRWT